MNILDTPMAPNDAGAATVRGYLLALARQVWEDGEGFSGKRPFGNSSWEYEVYDALAAAGRISGTKDECDCWDISHDERRRADSLILAAINAWIAEPVPPLPADGATEPA